MTTVVSGDSGGTVVTTIDVPPGIVWPYAGSSAPTGFLLCYGQAISRTTYANLYAVIGTTYGTGDGSTTFNLPDLRGRAVFGKDNMGGSAASRITSGVSGVNGTTLGASGGSEYMQSHNHSASGAGSVGNNLYNGTDRAMGTADGTNAGFFQSVAVTVNSTGSGTSQNMPPAFVLNYVIKY